MNELEKLLSFVPEPWRPKVMLAVLLSPYVTRALYSIMNGGGLKGIITSIWLGTNTPKWARQSGAYVTPTTPPQPITDTYNPKAPCN